jgi:predicted TIM-barrel fold metal-dependent hydrolase
MLENGVEKAIVVALAGYISNDFVAEVCFQYPKQLIPCASFDPSVSTNANNISQAFRAELKDSPFRLLKLHPRLNRYDPLDGRCLAVLDEISSWNKPFVVFLDTLFYNKHVTLSKSLVDTIHELVVRYSTLTFVLLHGGGSWCFSVAESIRDCSNCYLDLSWTLHTYSDSSVRNDIYSLAKRFDKRMVVGSDFPEISIKEMLLSCDRVFFDLDSNKKANIMGRNLEALIASTLK